MSASAFLRSACWAMRPLVILGMLESELHAQESMKGSIALPQQATALEGLPQVRIETTRESVSQRELDPAEAATNRLRIRIADGRHWSSRGDRPLGRAARSDWKMKRVRGGTMSDKTTQAADRSDAAVFAEARKRLDDCPTFQVPFAYT